ncbi:MAG: hypothetical protein J0H20_20005 [Rhizobiales bacterium]|nr:hypothetical protein [Hyphomicrobiales bacterium]
MLVSLVGSALAVDGERLCGAGRGTAREAHACRRVEEQRESERIDQFVDRLERAACRATFQAGRA